MTTLDFNAAVNAQIERCAKLLLSKGEEYAPETDRLGAFKKASALEGSTPEWALFGMAAKHLVSVADMCGHGIDNYSAERWDEKITDSINYLLLLRAMVAEQKGEH